MAETLYLQDGTHEVILNSDPTEEFSRIIYERLGRDAEDTFNKIIEVAPTSEYESLKAEFECYEASLEEAHNALQEIETECDYLDFALKQTRVDRKEAQKAVDKIRMEIKNVL